MPITLANVVRGLRGPMGSCLPSLMAACLTACTPTACNDEERVVSREVEVLVGEPGPAVKEAQRRLLARGRSSIAILETGLYHADPIGRIRIVKVLVELGLPDCLPVLRHIARRDEDSLVRERAQDASARLEATLGKGLAEP